MLFMVIERFRNGDASAVYQRYREHGRMMPEGLEYIDSWVNSDSGRCFQLMQCDDPNLFKQWTAQWEDLVEFEIIPVVTSKQAAEAMTVIDSKDAMNTKMVDEAITKILQNHYVLAVHDNRKMSNFFSDLGFTVVSEPPGWVFLKKDNCTVMLGECRDAIPVSELGDHSYFAYLRVDDADRYHTELVGKGIRILSPLENMPWGMREFSLKSPEGHRIRIGQWLEE